MKNRSTLLDEIASALRIAAESDPGYTFIPDDLASSVRVLVARNAQLKGLVRDYERLVPAAIRLLDTDGRYARRPQTRQRPGSRRRMVPAPGDA